MDEENEKKINKVENDVDPDKQYQQQERDADDVIDKHSNQFPNFMALTKEEKLAFFKSLQDARKNVIDSGNKITERFGTIHDEYLNYFRNVEDNEGIENFKETLKCSGTNDSVSNSLQSGSFKSTYSAIPRRVMTKPVETIFIHMNMSTNSSNPSFMSLGCPHNNTCLLSKEDENGENGDSRNNSTQGNRPQTKRPLDDNSDKGKKKSNSRFVNKHPKLKRSENRKAQDDENTSEMLISNKSQLETLKSGEKEIFSSTSKETQDNILKENPVKNNEFLSMMDIMKEYEKPKDASPMKIKTPTRNIKGKVNRLRVKVVITSLESDKINNEGVSKRKERSRKSEKVKTKKGTGVLMENKKTKVTERKLVRSTDDIRKKRRQDNPIAMAKKLKERKKENMKTQGKGKGGVIEGSIKACQNKRNEEGGKVLVKGERSMIKNPGGKQEKKKILASRKKIQKDKPKEKTEKPKKERNLKSEKERQPVLAEKEKQEEELEEFKVNSRSSEKNVAEALGPLTETTETIKTEEEFIDTFFVDKIKCREEIEGEGNQSKDSLSSKSFQNDFGEVKYLEIENVDNDATPSMGTTDEEITIEVEEEDSIAKKAMSVNFEMRNQLDQIEPGKASSHLVTNDEDSVLQLWEQLKLLKMSDSDCVMETDSMTAQMGNENVYESRFTFLSNEISSGKGHFEDKKYIVVRSENKIQEDKGRREAAVLDFLKNEELIVINGDAIEKIKNLIQGLEKEVEPKGDAKPDKENLKKEYSHLAFEYIDCFTRLPYLLTNKREQELNTGARARLMATASHPELVENRNKKSNLIKKPRAPSDTSLLKDRKTKIEVRTEAKESTLQESKVDEDTSSLLLVFDSPITDSSSEEDDSFVTTPSTRKKLIEIFVRERDKFVEESIDGLKIIKMVSRGCEVDTKVQGQDTGQNRTKFKFFHIFSRFFKCIKKKGSEEEQTQIRYQRTGGKEDR